MAVAAISATAEPVYQIFALDTLPAPAAGADQLPMLLGAWRAAVARGQSEQAVWFRRLIEAIDDEPTWEDAEWL